MGYQFAGFFAEEDVTLLEAAKQKWKQSRCRRIDTPFVGIGVACIWDSDASEEQNEVAEMMETELPLWSRSWTETSFVFIRADCFGGVCEFWGYVCRNGTVLKNVDADQSGDPRQQQENLQRLVVHLGVNLHSKSYFAPLTRNYFDHDPINAMRKN